MSRPKSLDQDREFVEIRKFRHFSTVFLDLGRELFNFIIFLGRDFSLCRDFWAWCTSKSLKNVEISRQISLRLDKSWKSSLRLNNLDTSRQSWQKSRRVQVSTEKVSILKISSKKKKMRSRLSRKSQHLKKVSLDVKDVLDLDRSWLSRPPGLFQIFRKLQFVFHVLSLALCLQFLIC